MCNVLCIIRQNYYKYRNTVDRDYYDYLEIKLVFLVKRNSNVEKANQVWTTDIAYIIYNGK